MCSQCGRPADVAYQTVQLCAEHYTRYVSRCYSTADRLVYDEAGDYWRAAREPERLMQDRILRSKADGYAQNREFGAKAAGAIVAGLKAAPTLADKYKQRVSAAIDDYQSRKAGND
jgi:hypothetical protein